MLQYNIFSLLRVCFKNKDLIAARLRGETIENYTYREMDTLPSGGVQTQVQDRLKSLFGLDPAVFAVVVAVLVGFWLLGIYLLYTCWTVLPLWGKIFGVLGVLGFVTGSALTIATALIAPECKIEVPHSGGANENAEKGDVSIGLASKFLR
jgi:hypothetical protein